MSIATMTPTVEQAAPGERDEEERDRERAAAEEEGEVTASPMIAAV